MREDMGDLRFSSSSGKPFPHWLEPMPGDVGVAWVRLPSVPEGTSEFGLTFGRRDVDPTGNGSATFLLYDDFSEGFDETRWERNRDARDGGCGVYVEEGILHVRGGDDNGVGWLKSRPPLPPQLCVMGRWRLHRENAYARGGLCFLAPAYATSAESWRPTEEQGCLAGVEFNHYTYSSTATPNQKAFYPVPGKSGVSLPGYWQDTWFTQSLGFDGGDEIDNLVYTRVNEEKHETVVHTVAPFNDAIDEYVHIFIRPWAWFSGPTHHFAIDWIAVRPFVRDEPHTRVLVD